MEVHRIPQGQYVDALRWLPMPSTVALSLWDADTGHDPSSPSPCFFFDPNGSEMRASSSCHYDVRSIRVSSGFHVNFLLEWRQCRFRFVIRLVQGIGISFCLDSQLDEFAVVVSEIHSVIFLLWDALMHSLAGAIALP